MPSKYYSTSMPEKTRNTLIEIENEIEIKLYDLKITACGGERMGDGGCHQQPPTHPSFHPSIYAMAASTINRKHWASIRLLHCTIKCDFVNFSKENCIRQQNSSENPNKWVKLRIMIVVIRWLSSGTKTRKTMQGANTKSQRRKLKNQEKNEKREENCKGNWCTNWTTLHPGVQPANKIVLKIKFLKDKQSGYRVMVCWK